MSDAISAMAAYAQIKQQNHIEGAAYRTANATSHGFKRNISMATHNPVPIAGTQRNISFPKIVNTHIDMSQGALQPTGNNLHLAISGQKGFFQVETPDGQRLLTRRGNFKLNTANQLITTEGYTVIGNGAPVVIAPNEDITKISIGPDGAITSPNGVIGKVDVVSTEDLTNLRAVNNSYFLLNGGEPEPVDPTEYMVHQGVLEQSNTIPVQETAEVARLAQESTSTRKLIEQTYERRKKFISDIGNVEGH